MNSSTDVIGSRSMTVDQARTAQPPTSFASQLAFDIHVLTTDVSGYTCDSAE